LLLGANGTGKSRIVKSLFWILGCAPQSHPEAGWDPDTVGAVEFEFGGSLYSVLRQGKRFGLLDGDGNVLFAEENLSAWDRRIAPFFGYHLALRRPSAAGYSQAGPEYLTLPYYLDQDGSWGVGWDTYKTLSQFQGWKAPVFETFAGLRPNAYFQAKQAKDELRSQITLKRRELDAQRSAFDRVKNVLPRNLPTLDQSAFRSELAEIARRAREVQGRQITIRGRLTALVTVRTTLHSELQLAAAAHQDVVADLKYLSDSPGRTLECPTCGTVHEKSFHARLQLGHDSESMSALVAELRSRLENTEVDEARLRNELREVEHLLNEIEFLMEEKKSKLRLQDVMAAHSKATLSRAFRAVSADLGEAIGELEGRECELDETLRKFVDRQRSKQIRAYFAEQVVSLSTLLNVPADERIAAPKLGDRARTGGSAAPRSILAMHLALLRTNVEYGDTAIFPLVVDTPQQQGQDDNNLRAMIELLGRSAGNEHQILLAAERVPEGTDVSDFSAIRFESRKSALCAADFDVTLEKLRAPLRSVSEAIKRGKANAADPSNGSAYAT
jgi:hypothetical protein